MVRQIQISVFARAQADRGLFVAVEVGAAGFGKLKFPGLFLPLCLARVNSPSQHPVLTEPFLSDAFDHEHAAVAGPHVCSDMSLLVLCGPCSTVCQDSPFPGNLQISPCTRSRRISRNRIVANVGETKGRLPGQPSSQLPARFAIIKP